MRYFGIIFLLSMVLISSVGADNINRHSSLYMDVTVKSVVGVVSIDGSPSGNATYNVTFINNVGDEFFFTSVTKQFKPGDKATLEFVVDFKGEMFVVIDAFYVLDDTRFTYPDNKPDEWKMFVGIGCIMLTMLFGGYLLGLNNRPYNRKIRR